MTVSAKELGIEKLSVDERLALIEDIWAGICADPAVSSLTSLQREELLRRIADDDAFPDEVTSWEEVRAEAKSRFAL